MSNVVRFCIAIISITTVVFFSIGIQKTCLKIVGFIGSKLGVSVKSREVKMQRYVFSNTRSPVSKLYKWSNNQIICLGLKKHGVTPIGFLTFWALLAIPITVVIIVLGSMGTLSFLPMYFIVYTVLLYISRIRTASRFCDRERDIMDSIDMIIPDIGSGVKNAIVKYLDSFPESLSSEYRAFVDRIDNRSFSFHDSMILLADSIGGSIFADFAQKSIFFEQTGERDSLEIFDVIVETNRIRVEMREKINEVFEYSRTDFITASIIVWLYAFGIGLREKFTYDFIFGTTTGQFILVLDICIEIFVLGYITSMKSREI